MAGREKVASSRGTVTPSREKVVSSRSTVTSGRYPVYLTLYEASQASGIGYQTLAAAVKDKTLKVAKKVQVGAKRTMPMIASADLEAYKAAKANRKRKPKVGPIMAKRYATYLGLDEATGLKLRTRFVESGGKPNRVEIL